MIKTRYFATAVICIALQVQSVGRAETCAEPVLKAGMKGDAVQDAAGVGQMFESIKIPNITELADGSGSGVIADFNKDSRLDILIVNDGKQRTGGGKGGILNLYINKGCFEFERTPILIEQSAFNAEAMGPKTQIANVVDFNKDGFLDIFLTRNRGPVHGQSIGNNLLVSQGAWNKFKDLGRKMGVANDQAYNRQSSIADVNGDGWLDIAVAADNIGNTQRLGLPRHRFYIYRPAKSAKFEDGKFEDISGSSVLPDFPGEFTCNPNLDRASPGIMLRDLDNDGDLDLVQSYHIDMNMAQQDDPCASGEYFTGVWVWENQLKNSGEFVFKRLEGGGLAESARSRWNADTRRYEAQGKAISLPYVNSADLDNDGLLDVIAVGPTDLNWTVKTDMSAIKYWRNLGAMKFEAQTTKAGLDPVNWTYRQWSEFFGVNLDVKDGMIHNKCPKFSTNYELCKNFSRLDYTMYGASTLLEDFNNDGYVDVLVADRHELDGSWGDLRNVLFMNKGDGTFNLVKTEVSGIDRNSISMEAGDLNGDGLVDVVLFADPGHSYPEGRFGLPPIPIERYIDTVFWNTGNHGGKKNNWLTVAFTGVSDPELVGAKVYVLDGDKIVGTRHIFSNHAYKSGGALRAHFGLGKRKKISIVVNLPNGAERRFRNLEANRLVMLDLSSEKSYPIN